MYKCVLECKFTFNNSFGAVGFFNCSKRDSICTVESRARIRKRLWSPRRFLNNWFWTPYTSRNSGSVLYISCVASDNLRTSRNQQQNGEYYREVGGVCQVWLSTFIFPTKVSYFLYKLAISYISYSYFLYKLAISNIC